MAEWITSREAAELSGYHPEHLRRLIREEKITARKFGIVWQIDRQSLLAYLKAAEQSGDQRRGPKDLAEA
jgi:excisionase family DNA binding protein